MRLFDEDSYIKEFTAIVLNCEKCDSGYAITLDDTAFFPEGGGQKGDTGTLDNITVFDTQEKDGIIYHYTSEPIETGKKVAGKLDWFKRFCKMQNHTAEHIISGIIHSHFGFDNVGFHLGENFVTLDFNGEFSEKDIKDIEREANEVSAKGIKIKAWYPENFATMEYRSKLDLTENVRIVEIEGVDRCACCAPHVKNTSETGLIKILHSEKNKGGTRFTMKSGFFALDEFNMYQDNIRKISAFVSLPPEKTAEGVEKLKTHLAEKDAEVKNLKLENTIMMIKNGSDRYAFVKDADMLKDCANALFEKYKGTVGAFSGDDENGYRYMILTEKPLQTVKALAEQKLNARGGGRDSMLQGMAKTQKENIIRFFE